MSERDDETGDECSQKADQGDGHGEIGVRVAGAGLRHLEEGVQRYRMLVEMICARPDELPASATSPPSAGQMKR